MRNIPDKENNFPEDFIDPETASLDELLSKNAIYIPRKLDIIRLGRLAFHGKKINDPERDNVRILDIGGGKGFLDKLLADEFNKKKVKCTVIDMDTDGEKLDKAKLAYGNTKGLKFVQADADNEGVSLYPEPFDLTIVSWPEQKQGFGAEYRYTDIIHRNRPAIVVWIGDTSVGDLTAEFDMKEAYIPLAEWHNRERKECEKPLYYDYPRSTFHGTVSNPVIGSNLITVYVRADIPKKEISKLKQLLKGPTPEPYYPWEKDIEKIWPEDNDSLTFNVKKRIIPY